ncbi:hypothetical protein M406DRAFT_320266 [Cryphonectria parasitica EP155]|uniref:Uncharacterized protein n=1 Tax=Cryphonectria parasitica (strain ATCC 38755 / EP155) TaxID=660469 RepID=A0A9P4YC15_CRYP1|nr:uncharacterized protein M406DRAFT_320266 [Cryphonectria parasitica EP155]KAF3770234.1 hypothetical protein M406DRAFT_320266 [Cryphonectria parasitica EP155]
MFRISQLASSSSVDEVSSTSNSNTPRNSSLSSASWCDNEVAAAQAGLHVTSFRLPHRTGSSTTGSSPAGPTNKSHSTPASSGISPETTTSGPTVGRTSSSMDGGIMLTDHAVVNTEIFEGTGAGEGQVNHGIDMNMFQGLNAWDAAVDGGPQDPSALYAQVTEAMLNDDSWMGLNEVGNSSWDTGQADEVQAPGQKSGRWE